MEVNEQIEALAQEAYDSFEKRTRDDGETFVTLKDDRPDWVHDATMEAHGDFLPDDWRYEAIRSCFGAISDVGEGTDLDDYRHEWADGYVDVYTAARLAWLASNLNRAGYVQEAVDEGIAGDTQDIAELAGIGQYMEASEVYGYVVDALEARAEATSESLA